MFKPVAASLGRLTGSSSHDHERQIRTKTNLDIHILLKPFEKKELAEQSRKKSSKRSSINCFSYQNQQRRNKKIVKRCAVEFDLNPVLVENILVYARSLVTPETNDIAKSVFIAQMARHFDLTGIVLLERMYEVCELNVKTGIVNYEEYVELICIFITPKSDLRTQFVFKVYNVQGTDFLSKWDIEHFVKLMLDNIDFVDPEFFPEAFEENETWTHHEFAREFRDLIVKVLDEDGDENVDLQEFRNMVKKNELMLECLGKCLPSEDNKERFLSIFADKTPLQCTEFFIHEREASLNLPRNLKTGKGAIQKYYPITMEL